MQINNPECEQLPRTLKIWLTIYEEDIKQNPREFVYNMREGFEANVCRALRFFRYSEFKGPQDLLQRLDEFTLTLTDDG